MKTSFRARIAVAAVMIGATAAMAAPADDAPAQAMAPARWAPRELSFIYQGFTTAYSCDGLLEQMRQILRQLGAGDDLVLEPRGCTQLNGPEVMPGVHATFSVLEPAGTDDHAGTGPAGTTAHWGKVTLDAGTPRRSASGDCELIEQVKRQVVPLFTTRNLMFRSSCFPHEVSLAGAHLSVEVLQPVQPEPAAQPGPRR